MGGGSSKVADKYVMVTDRKLTNEYYQKVERSSMPQDQMKSSRSMNVSSATLKKEQSENSISMTSSRKSDAPMLVRNKTEINLKSSNSCNNGVVISARLPWLVKEASISSASAGDRIQYGRIIGSGLMGTVRVCMLDQGKYVAVKSISKKYILKHNDTRHVNAERTILTNMKSPFCIKLFGTYQDGDYIHFVMEYAPGGELFRRLTRKDSFPSNVAKFYTCEVFLALDHVQQLGYVYRDLKPENVMLDEYGHCKLVDFGFAMTPNEHGMCTTNVGTPAYLSPEQLNGKFTNGYTCIVDWWALGVFIYELLTSVTPFCSNYSESSFEIYTRVLNGKIKYPGKNFTPASKELVSSLLHSDVKRRMVNPREIEKHPFFADVDWGAIKNRQVIPPFTPRLPTEVVNDMNTVCHFDDHGPDNKPPGKALTGKNYQIDSDFRNF